MCASHATGTFLRARVAISYCSEIFFLSVLVVVGIHASKQAAPMLNRGIAGADR